MKRRIVFLQLPGLDNDLSDAQENVPLAARYLRHALRRSGEHSHYDTVATPPGTDTLDDAHLVEALAAQAPDVVAATLYAWNVERTLHVLRRLKRRRPSLLVAVGGPEVTPDHPFLYRTMVVDVAVSGEGEVVFPQILAALRKGARIDLRMVGRRAGRRFVWGRRATPPVTLREALPPVACIDPADARGVAYLETSRGCPLRCAFCCYHHRRRTLSCLAAGEVVERVSRLRRAGAREIRFIDPTFNANPEFTTILRRLARLNRDRGLRFFAELRADRVTAAHAALLADANVCEVEVGVQSRDAEVLRRVGRPTDLTALDRGVNALARAGIRLTLDVMCGLPGQSANDVRESLAWASSVRGARVQFLHTLLLPGTPLRAQRRGLRLRAQPRPPYRVLGTPWLAADTVRELQRLAEDRTGEAMDCRTARFVGTRLRGLFRDRTLVLVPGEAPPRRLPGRENRRAMIFRGADLFAHRSALLAWVQRALRREPHVLWQFVLEPRHEEPLDLVDVLVEAIDDAPGHFLDRISIHADGPVRAARRVFVRLRSPAAFTRSWTQAAEDLLRAAFL